MGKALKRNALVVTIFVVFAFICNIWLPLTVAAHPATTTIQLHRVDFSGVYALPPGVCLKNILVDGEPAMYVLVKNGIEVDVWAARPNSKVEAVIYK
jgi:hypothetical protein